jgi:hypothetical protein
VAVGVALHVRHPEQTNAAQGELADSDIAEVGRLELAATRGCLIRVGEDGE